MCSLNLFLLINLLQTNITNKAKCKEVNQPCLFPLTKHDFKNTSAGISHLPLPGEKMLSMAKSRGHLNYEPQTKSDPMNIFFQIKFY